MSDRVHRQSDSWVQSLLRSVERGQGSICNSMTCLSQTTVPAQYSCKSPPWAESPAFACNLSYFQVLGWNYHAILIIMQSSWKQHYRNLAIVVNTGINQEDQNPPGFEPSPFVKSFCFHVIFTNRFWQLIFDWRHTGFVAPRNWDLRDLRLKIQEKKKPNQTY